MDETKGAEQDTTSGKPGQSSDGKGGTTSKDKGRLYSAADIAKVISDAKSEAGRLQKAAEQARDSLTGQLQTVSKRLNELEKTEDESRLAEARGDPSQLRLYQREQAVKTRERAAEEKEGDLKNREGQLKTDRADVDKDKGVVSVAYLAAKHGLKTEDLESLGISDPEALERVAEQLAAAKGGQGDKGGEGKEGEEGEFSPDSSEGTGGPGTPTTEQLDKMSMPEYAAWRKKTMK